MNVGVILLGALVRATDSGAGCGRSWPSCQGAVIPARLEGATAIEFLHRVTSGVALLVVLILYVVARRAHPRGVPARTAALVSGFAIVGEALIGAGIVLFEWVADDASVARTIAVPLHLVNTLLLLAAIAAVVILSDGRQLHRPSVPLRRVLVAGLGSMVLVAATGAIAALADTLFPSESVASGVADDFSAASNFLTRLRGVHPIVAVGVGLLLVWLVTRPESIQHVAAHPAARMIPWIVATQISFGLINVVLLVPVWTQLVHLLIADILWISFVWFALDAIGLKESDAHRSSVSSW